MKSLKIDVSDVARIEIHKLDGTRQEINFTTFYEKQALREELSIIIKKHEASTNEVSLDGFTELAARIKTNPSPHTVIEHAAPKRAPILKPSARAAYPADFEAFYRAYPNRQNKAAAFKAWAKLKPDAALQAQMLRAVAAKSQSKEWLKDGGDFIPHPASWINARRWEDDAHVDIDGDRMRADTAAHVDMMRSEEHFQ